MKQINKIIIPLLAATLLLLAGCVNNKVQTGRYVEKEIVLADIAAMSNPAAMPDGRIAMLCRRDDQRYLALSSDLLEWEYIPTDAMGTFLAWDDGGQRFLLSTSGFNTHYVGLNGQTTKVSWKPNVSVLTGEMIKWALPLPDGDVFFAGKAIKPSIYNAQGQLKQELPFKDVIGAAVWGNQVYIQLQEGALYALDVSQGGNAVALPSPGMAARGSLSDNTLTVDSQGALYLASLGGISRLKQSAEQWEHLLGRELFVLNESDTYILSMAATPQGDLITVLNSLEGKLRGNSPNRTMNYHWDPELKPLEAGLSIASLKEIPQVRQAAMLMQKNNPDQLITYQPLIRKGESLAVADAIRIFNTDMMSGKGADVVVLDGLNQGHYIRSGLLMDLSQWAQPYIEGEQWLPGVAASLEDEQGRIYSIPTRVGVQILFGKPEELVQIKTLEQWMQWVQAQPPGRANVPSMAVEEWIRWMYQANSPAWPTDEKGRPQFDSPEFIQYLEAIKLLSGGVFTDNELNPPYTRTGRTMDDRDHLIYNNEIAFQWIPSLEIDLLHYWNSISYHRSQGQPGAIVLPAQASNTYAPIITIGVNANTQNQQQALELLDLLCSEQIQGIGHIGQGVPLRSSSIDNLVNAENGQFKLANGRAIATYLSPDGWVVDVYYADKEMTGQLREIFNKLDTPGYMPDETLVQAIKQEAMSFFEGHITAQQAAQALSKRIQAYLAE